MNVSLNFYELLQDFEGMKLKAYKDSAGIWTIGIGTIKYPDGPRVNKGDEITEKQALDYCAIYCHKMIGTVNGLLTGVTVNQNQFDAICLLSYNIGTGAFAASTALRLIRKDPSPRNELLGAWLAWNKARVNGELKPVKGLTNRRTKEYKLYESIN
jgi:lysozyme